MVTEFQLPTFKPFSSVLSLLSKLCNEHLISSLFRIRCETASISYSLDFETLSEQERTFQVLHQKLVKYCLIGVDFQFGKIKVLGMDGFGSTTK